MVTAEQLAPLLEPPLASSSEPLDESFVLPALTRLNGTPEVTPNGDIVYRFPDLASTASKKAVPARPGSNIPMALREWRWELTAARSSQVASSVMLGVLNAGGVAYLTYLMQSPAILQAASAELLRAVSTLLPGLQLYASLFFLIPAVRSVIYARRNAAIDARNEARRKAERTLRQLRPQLAAKLQAAAARAQSASFDEARAVFSSDVSAEAAEAAEFERRLEERAADRDAANKRKQ